METLSSFSTSYLLSFILSGLVVYFILSYLRKGKKRYPPGPKGWPILGYLPILISSQPGEVIKKFQQQYEHVFMFPVGTQNIVIFNSMEAVKDSYIKQGEVFSGKPSGFNLMNYGTEYLGVFTEEGDSWKEQRKFIMSTLREFGVGKLAIENKILEECDALKQEVAKSGDDPFTVVSVFGKATTNVITSIVFGNRYDYDDPKFIKWVNICNRIEIELSKLTLMDFFPLIDKLPGWMNGLNHVDQTLKGYHEHANEQIDRQIKTYKENEPRGFIDCFLDEMHRRDRKGEKNHFFDSHRMTINVLVLNIGGTVSTTMTLTWTIKLLLMNPNALKKLVQEIDTVIGRERQPSWLDRANMPYTEAVMYEVSRVSDLGPIGVPRSNTEEVKVLGYDIPKRSMVFINHGKLNSDPELWGDPENFRPERYIDANTNACVKPEYLLPFGAGRRSCPGDVLARMNIFLMLVSLLQNFTISLPSNTNMKELDDVTPGLIRYIENFHICAKRRT